MTFRAIILGGIGAFLIGVFGYLNDQVLALESLVAGHLVPISVFGALIVGVMLVNPALSRVRSSWRFRPSEVAVVLAMTLVGCSIPTRGLMEQFTPALAMPVYFGEVRPGWRKTGVLDYVPPSMLPADGQYSPEVIGSFVGGRHGEEYISLGDVPWRHWRRPLATWMPLIGLLAVSVICLGLIVHRQWSRRECLRYPIADFATHLIDPISSGSGKSIFHNRIFWIGLAIPLTIHLVNGINTWYPETISIKTAFDFSALGRKWPMLWKLPWGGNLMRPRIYLMVIAFSFFLASDVSLSLGLSQFMAVLMSAALLSHGVAMSENYMTGGGIAYMRSGAYVGFTFVLAYLGRRHYGQVLKAALTFRRDCETRSYEAWACRILLVSAGAMIAWMTALGLDWPISVMTVLLMLLTFVCVARISAETGLFFIQPRWQALGVLIGLFGTMALGPKAIIMVGMFCVVLSIDPSQSLLPYFVNGLRMCDRFKVAPPRVGWSAITTYVIVAGAAVIVVLWANYNFGIQSQGNWSSRRTPAMPFRPALTAVTQLKLADNLDQSEQFTPLQRLANMSPGRSFLGFAGAGLALILLVSLLRLRLPWWPLHPVMFLVWATFPMATLHYSFLLGWLTKSLVVKFGGGKAYTKTKPLMIGVIAGEILGGLIFMVVGVIYYSRTGVMPLKYQILPK